MDNASKKVKGWRNTIGDLNKQAEVKQARIEKLKERKSSLTLAACTGGTKAQEELVAINADLLIERQGLEDIEEAVAQAEAELAKADEALAIEQEAERLRVLAALATERVKVARLVDQTAMALGQALAGYNGIGDKIYRLVAPRDIPFGTKVRSTGRVEAAVAHHLEGYLSNITFSRQDPRARQSLEGLEADQLSRLLIDPARAGEIAGMNPGDTPTGEPERSAA